MGRGGKGWRHATASSYEITFTFRGQRCRERINLKPSPANDKAVERHRHAILDAIERGTFEYRVTFPDSPRAALFAERQGEVQLLKGYLDGWLKRQKALTSASTWNDYRKSINNHLIPAFGHHRLSDLKRLHVKEWAANLTVSNKRLANLVSPLRIALQEAVEDELIETNPLFGWSYQRKEAPKPGDDVDPFTPTEQSAILGKLTGHGLHLVQFAFWSGLRTSELVALEWGDIDWHRGVVRVSRAETQAADCPEETKTRAGTRDVKILPAAMEALTAQKAFSLLHPSGRVFLNPRTGEPWVGDQPIRKTLWTHALTRAKVRYRRPYQTRHTYASMMLSAGESPLWVAQQMGHSDWTMIARVYGRWIPDADPNAGMRAAAVFGSGGGNRMDDAEGNDSNMPAGKRN
jgi:integrase